MDQNKIIVETSINGVVVSIRNDGLYLDGDKELDIDTLKRIESCTITFHEALGNTKAYRMIYWIDHVACTLAWFDKLEKIYNLISVISCL